MATVPPSLMPAARQYGWNIKFVDYSGNTFAGVYSRDLRVLADLRAVFDFPPTPDLSFWLDGQSSTTPTVLFEASPDNLDHVLETSESGSKAKYIVAHHSSADCRLPAETDLSVHKQAGCANLVRPKCRRHPFYLPVHEKSTDPLVCRLPFRGSASKKPQRGSGSSVQAESGSPSVHAESGSPSVHAESGSPSVHAESGSPSVQSESGATETAENSDVVVPSCLMDKESLQAANKQRNHFRSLAVTLSNFCAVSGVGRSWCPGLSVGPGIQAAHIVPHMQYHLYPRVSDNDRDSTDVQQERTTPVLSDLKAAWENTWSVRNSIILSSAIHEAFDQRLLAIHPDSHLIRVFAPYDLITPYHGRKADFGQGAPDPNALRWHWDVCVLENMGATMGLWRPESVRYPGGTGSPAPGLHLPDAEDEDDGGDSTGPPSALGGPDGRPAKRRRTSQLREQRDEDDMPDLSHSEGSPPTSFAESGRQQGRSRTTKKQRTVVAWLDGIPCGSQDGGISIRDLVPT
ncbi:hypothetical protein MAPG_10799 [Magnaporthiopsis poae ATCC 64411]|uniref:HNH nuclease domain-containing protein n=1 Tax=Magnaporthiopsis poae (strain ATCC 64411 / 73-15) TaxID=644358 RepID=A0A0C4EDJ7_MAGP6|nr:hypothetical protein MAPG_10799 [Magnaporthiopsis poae ATCC 64411]